MKTDRLFAAVVITAMVMQFQARAQNDEGRTHEWFRKGAFAGVEVSAGVVTGWENIAGSGDMKHGASGGNAKPLRLFGMPDYELGMFIGYRFDPLIALAAGIGGSNSTVTGTTAMPVFLRLRSDILDRRVSPIFQLDIGYAFQFAHSKRSTSELSYNSEPFPERYTGLGFSNSEEYVDARIEEFMKQFGDNLSPEESDRLKAEERERARNDLCSFGNGQLSYLPAGTLDELGCFSKDGFFGSLTAGVSIGVGKGQSRLSAGVSVGLAQYSYSIRLRSPDNSFINMSVPASLPDGTPVIIARTSIKDNPVRLDLRLRIVWEF